MSIKNTVSLAKDIYNSSIRTRVEEKGKLLYMCIYGSHLFGTSSETSDIDIKGIYLPYKKDIILGNHVPTISKKEVVDGIKVDFECWSLQYLQHLLAKGDTNVIDTLYSQTYPDAILYADEDFLNHFSLDNIKNHILHNKIRGIVNYCQDQAEYYVIKSNRINSLKMVIDFLSTAPDHSAKMKSIWDELPIGEFALKLPSDNTGFRLYEVCGRKFHETTEIAYVLNSLSNSLATYGGRSMNASDSFLGKDLKSISHAYRAAVEYLSLLSRGKIVFPLEEAYIIKAIKYGEYSVDIAKSEIEFMLNVISKIDDGTVFPSQTVDMDFLKGVILSYYNEN
jgi:hypothetical protein